MGHLFEYVQHNGSCVLVLKEINLMCSNASHTKHIRLTEEGKEKGEVGACARAVGGGGEGGGHRGGYAEELRLWRHKRGPPSTGKLEEDGKGSTSDKERVVDRTKPDDGR